MKWKLLLTVVACTVLATAGPVRAEGVSLAAEITAFDWLPDSSGGASAAASAAVRAAGAVGVAAGRPPAPVVSNQFVDVFAGESADARDELRLSEGKVFLLPEADSGGAVLALGSAGLDRAATPEPATLLLMGAGLAGLTRAAQRRRRT